MEMSQGPHPLSLLSGPSFYGIPETASPHSTHYGIYPYTIRLSIGTKHIVDILVYLESGFFNQRMTIESKDIQQ